MRRDKRDIRQEGRPALGDVVEILSVGAVTMQKDDEGVGLAACRFKAWAVDFSHGVSPGSVQTGRTFLPCRMVL